MLCCDTMYKAFNKAFSFIKCVILFSINIYIPNLMPGRCYQKGSTQQSWGAFRSYITIGIKIS